MCVLKSDTCLRAYQCLCPSILRMIVMLRGMKVKEIVSVYATWRLQQNNSTPSSSLEFSSVSTACTANCADKHLNIKKCLKTNCNVDS